MSKFLQGDLVNIHTDVIPNTDVPVKKHFPLRIGIVSHSTVGGGMKHIVHLIPVDKVRGRMTQEDHINWVKEKFRDHRGQLVARDEKYRSKWFFWEKDLRSFRFSDGNYFDEDLFKID